MENIVISLDSQTMKFITELVTMIMMRGGIMNKSDKSYYDICMAIADEVAKVEAENARIDALQYEDDEDEETEK